jgi:hypothetical protein
MDKVVSDYLASIGEKGGCKSRRKLSGDQAKTMVRIREARRAFRHYYSQCFWSCNPDLVVSAEDVKWIGKQLMKYGDRKAWAKGAKLCR